MWFLQSTLLHKFSTNGGYASEIENKTNKAAEVKGRKPFYKYIYSVYKSLKSATQNALRKYIDWLPFQNRTQNYCKICEEECLHKAQALKLENEYSTVFFVDLN